VHRVDPILPLKLAQSGEEAAATAANTLEQIEFGLLE
jgi:hypothetical protein